jgi:hypothetical protein
MQTQIFLALNRRGFVKATKGKSGLAVDEIGVMLSITVPDSSFRSPTLAATLDVPEHAVVVPELKIEVADPE